MLTPNYPKSLRRPAAFAMLAIAAITSGCATNSYCKSPQAYENAPSIPPIKAPEGLNISTPSTALKVPDVKVDSVTFGYYVPDPNNKGESQLRCLDQPPILVLAPETTP